MEPFSISHRRAVTWDRMVTVFIVVLLFVPMPFARFQVAPRMTTILERPVMPWSRFQIRYVSYPQGLPQAASYGFTWKGQMLREPGDNPAPQRETTFAITPANEPLLRWQDNPDIRLGEMFVRGEVLKVTSFWQPVIFYPLRMGWQARSN
jgi:hypothetical protein